jgi:hypothetical protein
MQVPLLQMLPAAHFTPAQRFSTQVPPLQSWPEAQWTAAQGLGDAQVRLQAFPTPQAASHASSITQAPVPGLQYCPEEQVTPLHGWRKHPARQAPETQVWPTGQLWPAHGSVTATQVARQAVPVAQLEAAARQGSG